MREMRISRWGNSLAIRFPAAVVEALARKAGDSIEVHVVGERAFEVNKVPTTRSRARRWQSGLDSRSVGDESGIVHFRHARMLRSREHEMRKYIGVVSSLILVSPAFAGIQENRASWLGPEVGRSATFTAHVVGAEKRGALHACPKDLRGGQVIQSREQQMALMKQRQDYVAERHKPLYEAHRREITEAQRQAFELATKVRRGEITREEYQKRHAASQAEQQHMVARFDAKIAALNAEAEKKYPLVTGTPVLTVRLQHSPRSPQDLIIPLDGDNPSSAFTDALNAALAQFLSTCGPINTVVVLHYYRDAERRGAEQGEEKEVLRNLYALPQSKLVLQPARPRSPDSPYKLAEYEDMTLAGFRAQDARIRRIHADYRQDFQYKSRRKPGVVYKYDEFWKSYPDFEIARRIFDGDFENYANTIDFAFLYTNFGGQFTARCRAHVKEIRRIYYPTRTYVGGEIDPGDLTFQAKYEDGMGYFEIDARFADRQSEFILEQTKYMLKNWLDGQKRGERFVWTVEGIRSGVHDVLAQGKLPPIQQFFGNTPCTSPVMRQLGDNIHRAANRMPSLQAAGIRTEGAEAASDPPTRL
jgi:antitoxin component of MazEF toxin-antitoxin module